MKKNLHNFIVLMVLTSFIFAGCEKEEIMMSTSRVERKLQSTWKKVEMTAAGSNSAISWKFNEGKVYLIKNEIVLASGNYNIDVSITRVHITTSDFPNEGYDYMNGTWKLLTLNDDILVMADTYSGGTLQVEFTKER